MRGRTTGTATKRLFRLGWLCYERVTVGFHPLKSIYSCLFQQLFGFGIVVRSYR